MLELADLGHTLGDVSTRGIPNLIREKAQNVEREAIPKSALLEGT